MKIWISKIFKPIYVTIYCVHSINTAGRNHDGIFFRDDSRFVIKDCRLYAHIRKKFDGVKNKMANRLFYFFYLTFFYFSMWQKSLVCDFAFKSLDKNIRYKNILCKMGTQLWKYASFEFVNIKVGSTKSGKLQQGFLSFYQSLVKSRIHKQETVLLVCVCICMYVPLPSFVKDTEGK